MLYCCILYYPQDVIFKEGWSKAVEVVLALDVYCVKPVCEQTGSAVLF